MQERKRALGLARRSKVGVLGAADFAGLCRPVWAKLEVGLPTTRPLGQACLGWPSLHGPSAVHRPREKGEPNGPWAHTKYQE